MTRYTARDRNIVNKVLAYYEDLPRYIAMCRAFPGHRLPYDKKAYKDLDKTDNGKNTFGSHDVGHIRTGNQQTSDKHTKNTNGKAPQGSLF